MVAEILTSSAEALSCQPPYSFFFDFIKLYFGSENSEKEPIHRLCVLARKAGAVFLIKEDASTSEEIKEEIQAISTIDDTIKYARATKFSFFTYPSRSEKSLRRFLDELHVEMPSILPEPRLKEWFIGQVVIINYYKNDRTKSDGDYVYCAIINKPKAAGLAVGIPDDHDTGIFSHHLTISSNFECMVRYTPLVIDGVYFCQQNDISSFCAHSALRMIINTIGPTYSRATPRRTLIPATLTNVTINSLLGIDSTSLNPAVRKAAKKALARGALAVSQIEQVIREFNFSPVVFDCRTSMNQHGGYILPISALIESGHPAMLIFQDKLGAKNPIRRKDKEHVVTVIGSVRNTNEWHPHVLPPKAGFRRPFRFRSDKRKSYYYNSSSWVDHFVAHDDDTGPYFTLNSRVLEIDPDISASWIVGVLPWPIDSGIHYRINLASDLISDMVEDLASNGNHRVPRPVEAPPPETSKRPPVRRRMAQVFSRISDLAKRAFEPERTSLPLISPGNREWISLLISRRFFPVLRPILIKKEEYIAHLKSSIGHDGTKMSDEDIAVLGYLPERFWMIEISIFHLFTANSSKLGELLFDLEASTKGRSPPDFGDLFLALRFPGKLIYADARGLTQGRYVNLSSHSKIFLNS
jgi:hypothetical protein